MMSARMFSDSEGRLRCSHQLHSSCTRPRLPSSVFVRRGGGGEEEEGVRVLATPSARAREICVAGPMTRSGAVGLAELASLALTTDLAHGPNHSGRWRGARTSGTSLVPARVSTQPPP